MTDSRPDDISDMTAAASDVTDPDVVPAGDEPAEGSEPAEDETSEPSPRVRRNALDTILSVIMWTLLVGVLTVGGWFGYSVWSVRQAEAAATPALRLVQQLRDEVRANPNNIGLRIRLGEALGAAGQYNAAIEQFENALRLDPENTQAYLDLAIIGILTEDWNGARRYLLRVVELTETGEFAGVDDRRELAFYNLGLISLHEKEYEDAISYLRGASRIRRDASDTYYHLALAFHGLEEYDAAFEQLEIALAFDPNYAQAHFLMGELYLEEDDEVNASYHFYRAAEAAPEADPPQEALASLGTAEERIARGEESLAGNDVEGALTQALVARNLAPESVEAALFHGEVLLGRGNYQDAVQVFEEALELAGGDDAAIQAEIEKAKELAGS